MGAIDSDHQLLFRVILGQDMMAVALRDMPANSQDASQFLVCFGSLVGLCRIRWQEAKVSRLISVLRYIPEIYARLIIHWVQLRWKGLSWLGTMPTQ